METLFIGLTLCTLLLISATHATSRRLREPENSAASAEKWFRKFSQQREKVAKLHFYVQETVGGPNSTIWEVARAEITSRSPTMFGQIRVVDDLLTVGPDRNSAELGRAQGLVTSSDMKESAVAMSFNFVFTTGEFNGSTLCVLGRTPIEKNDRELPVVGGTGAFRMARGFSISNIIFYDPAQNYVVLEFIVYVSYIEEAF